jgi:hypothetical protein
MGEVTSHDGVAPGDANGPAIGEAVDVAVARADPAGAEHFQTTLDATSELATAVGLDVGGEKHSYVKYSRRGGR